MTEGLTAYEMLAMLSCTLAGMAAAGALFEMLFQAIDAIKEGS